ncbi:cytochrome P450 [Polyporus arcularius HHB13444]|uniref:Cytochrome P450 n=1 Tax=Polyporus arcularius HHB13444 TaxID=1314778 RepID=A0A5C3NST8_9APHY|nr:cytochrome P450 [Polyporus arcularius HHB13444]
MADHDSWQFATAFVAVLFVLYLVRRHFDPLRSIPTIGPSAPLLSYVGAIRYILNLEGMVREGYKKYYGTIFKVAMLDGWLVIFTGPKLIDELRRSPDEELSADEGVAEVLQLRLTLGPGVDDQFHVAVVREKLTRNLAALYPDVFDEISVSFNEYIPATDDWTEVQIWPVVQKVIARASNRVIIGLPRCRDETYLDVAINFTNDVFASSFLINLFPGFLKPLIGKAVPMVSKNKKKLMPMVIPMLQERQRMMEAHGDDWEGHPRDLLQWLLEEARVKGTPFEHVVEKVLLVNFGAIHTSSGAFTHALYNVAAYPQYIQPLREEIEAVVAQDGWSKASLGKMRKLDSFFKETMRLADGSLLNIFRKAVKDVTLSDGTRIPKGTLVAAASVTAHTDDTRYPEPDVFDPFRFARMREGGVEDAVKHQLVNTSVDFLPFGHGKHACPGRFFAANEIKTMMAYLLLNYDMKFAEEGKRPANIRFGPANLPSTSAKVLFRKRRRDEETNSAS